MEVLRQLDASPSPEMLTQISDWITEVYELRGGGTLLGLFGHCFLGHPYIDHAFGAGAVSQGSVHGHGIIEHYRPEDTVPPHYRLARPLAESEAYAMIEIYSDGQIVPIRHDGTPAI